MVLPLSYILVKQIQSDVPRSTFSDAVLDEFANSILEAGGSLEPMVVRCIKPDFYEPVYEVVKGHFQYWAAVRAKELDPLAGEVIGVFVIEGSKSEALERQLQLLKR